MVQLCYPVISTFASHVYKSALPCCPFSSVLRTHYAQDLEGAPRITIGLRPSWNANVITLEGHTKLVRSAAYSPDGKQIVSASWDRTIRLWDAATGAQLHVLNAEESDGLALRPGTPYPCPEDNRNTELMNTLSVGPYTCQEINDYYSQCL